MARASKALIASLIALLGGCAAPRAMTPAWRPITVDPPALAPQKLLEVTVAEGAGDLAPALRAAIGEARLGTTSTHTFTVSVTPREHVVGKPERMANVTALHFVLCRDGARIAEDDVTAAASTRDEARRLALARLLVRVASALARSGEAPRAANASSEFPAVVVVERVAHSRDLLELTFVETLTGATLRREIVPLADGAAGPPGRPLLSRRTAEGTRLDDEGYASLVKRTGAFLDLRPVGDAHRLGYFGPRSRISAPMGATPSPAPGASPPPRTSTPPHH